MFKPLLLSMTAALIPLAGCGAKAKAPTPAPAAELLASVDNSSGAVAYLPLVGA